jgi:hypothetical protein
MAVFVLTDCNWIALAAPLVDVTVREASEVVPPTAKAKVTAPLPTLTVNPWVAATVPFTVEEKVTLLLLVVSVVVAPRVTAPL